VIIDLNDIPSQRFQCDICVVGTGAAGLTLASRLLKARKSVLFLESGGFELEGETRDLNRCEISDLHFIGHLAGRSRVIGGSTRCWAGQLLPLEPNIFERRPWINKSGWPFDSLELERYYKKALILFGADERNFDTDLYEMLETEDHPFDQSAFRFYFSKYSPHPDLRSVFMTDFEASSEVKLLYHANLTRIHLSEDLNMVTHVEVKNQKLTSFRIDCAKAILCLGGIESARMLLANNHQIAQGIGNQHGVVGKHFQDHPTLRVGILRSKDPARVYRLFGPKQHQGRFYMGKISLVPAKQRELSLLSATAYVDVGYRPRLLEKRMLINLLKHGRSRGHVPPATFRTLFRLVLGSLSLAAQRAIVRQRDQFVVTIMTEQEPLAESAISLGNTRDRYGVPHAKIQWRLTEKTWETVMCFAKLLKEQFESTRLGTIEFLPYIEPPSNLWRIYLHDMFHHMGSTRMALSPDEGVVDPNCKVFGIDNLYLLSSAVFPTSGHSNPTLTIVALAHRLLDHLAL
jgi:choline dehydrogenase-like flavoprotein